MLPTAIDKNGISFLYASKDDIPGILGEINSHYDKFGDADGFLVGYRNYDMILSDLKNFFVAKRGNDILGHVQIKRSLPEEFDSLDWYDQMYYEKLSACKNIIYISQVVVNSNYCNHGIGKFLYTNLFQEFKDYVFFSSVVMKPFYNKHSLKFHKRCGFIEVAYNKHDVVQNNLFESVYLARFPRK